MISEPAVLAGTAVITQSPNQVTFTAQNLQPNSTLVFMMQFAPGSLISAPPTLAGRTADCRRAARRPQRPTARLVCPGIVDFGRRVGGYVPFLSARQFFCGESQNNRDGAAQQSASRYGGRVDHRGQQSDLGSGAGHAV